jgi:MFS family permease
MPTAKPDSIWSQTFALLCLTQLLGYAHNAILTPTLPLYITQLGGSPLMVGFALASFAVTSVLLRPVIGHIADMRNEAGVLVFGCSVLAASMLLFLVPAAMATLPANALRGIGWAALNTGGYALLALRAPAMRRAEASGYYSGVQGGAGIIFPAVGLWLMDASFGFHGVMLAAGAFALAGALAGFSLRGGAPKHPAARHSADAAAIPLNPFALEREVLLPSALLFCLNLTYPATTAFLVLYARTMGIQHEAWYFVASGATSLLARPLLGRLGDRIGAGPSLAAGFILEMIALLLLNAASGLGLLLVCGVIFALGNAIGSSTTLAIAIQRAHPQRRGKAMASFSIAYPAASGVGALWTGSAVELAGYFWMYVAAAGLAAAGLAVTLGNWRNVEGR